MPLSLCFLVCDHFYLEMKAAVKALGVEAEVRIFPARCGHPLIQRRELTECVQNIDADSIEIFGSYCLQGVVDSDVEFSQCTLRKLDQCFYLVCSPTLVDALQGAGDYLLTSGWLARWHEHLAAWGFDQATAKDFFGQSVNRLLLLDTGIDEKSETHLDDFSKFIDCPADTLSIGFEFLLLSLGKIFDEHQRLDLVRQRDTMQCQAAESAMTLDLLGAVTKANTEPEVFARIEEMFTMLFAPRGVYCIPVTGKGLSKEPLSELSVAEQDRAKRFHIDMGRQYQRNESRDGFLLRIGRGEKTFVVVLVQQVEFPKYIESYIIAALNVSGVCALAVEHVRTLKKLLDTSWLAGKAEVATEVLHNVGNTLNSISVSSEHLREMAGKSSCSTLPGIVELIQRHQADMGDFFANDPGGRQLPLYFTGLSEQLLQEKENFLQEIKRQFRHIQQAAQIIRAQQAAVGGGGLVERIDLPTLLEESLEIFELEIRQEGITVEYDYTSPPIIQSERYKILQVLRNLLRNAIDALIESERMHKKITLRLYPVEGPPEERKKVVLEVADNGMGMSTVVLERIFAFGFTTKEGGHGFGLHNAANLIAAIGGVLTAESPVEGQGAVFRLRLPMISGRRMN